MSERYLKYIDCLIAREWAKNINNASDAHFRAQEITRLEKIKQQLITPKK